VNVSNLIFEKKEMSEIDKKNEPDFMEKPQFTRKELRKIYWMAFRAEFFRIPFTKTQVEKAIAKREKMEGR